MNNCFLKRKDLKIKKILPILLLALLVFSTQSVFATDQQEIVETDEGGYFVTEIEDESDSVSDIESSTATYSTTKTKSKTTRFYNSSDVLQWSVKVTGTFKYGGGSAKCTDSTVTATSSSAAWKISNKSASKSGAAAKASATAKRYSNGVAVQTLSKTVTLTCSPTGNFT